MFSSSKHQIALSEVYKYKYKSATSICPYFHDVMQKFLSFFHSLCTDSSATLASKHIVNLSLCARALVCVCACAGQRTLFSSLGPDIKAMSAGVWWDLTDNTSSPSFPFWSFLTRSSIQYIMQPPLFIPAQIFSSLSPCPSVVSATFLSSFYFYLLCDYLYYTHIFCILSFKCLLSDCKSKQNKPVRCWKETCILSSTGGVTRESRVGLWGENGINTVIYAVQRESRSRAETE